MPLAERKRLMQRIGAEFDRAGVNYAIIHEGKGDRASDSDLDIAVDREGLATIDWIIRTGAFGRLIQRFDYDVPWCRYYVVEADEPGRRYRQLDVACDPWGIGHYGPSVRLALEATTQSEGYKLAAPPAQTLYFALKRARKGWSRPEDTSQMRNAFARNPSAATALLEQHLGSAGTALANALRSNQQDLGQELRAVRKRAVRDSWAPAVVWRRLSFDAVRLGRRVIIPTGLMVALVGPDGVGKSTLAQGLATEAVGAFRHAERLHVGPGILPAPARLLGRSAADSTQPHQRPASRRAVSLVRVAYLWFDSRVGWWPKITVPRIRSRLVILERGWFDLLVDPLRYRVSVRPGIISFLGELLPKPDVLFLLDADSQTIRQRSTELTEVEIDRQLSRWREIVTKEADHSEVLDATRTAAAALEDALARIHDRLAARQLAATSSELALATLGKPTQQGTDYWVITRGSSARWFLRTDLAGSGLVGTGLYRPATKKHIAGAATLDAIRRTSRGRLGARSRLTIDPETGIGPAIGAALGRADVSIAGVAVPKGHVGRTIVSVYDDDGKSIAFAKVAFHADPLRHEQQILDELARIKPTTFVAPRAIAFFPWAGTGVLVLESLPLSGRSDRPLGALELDALVELSQLKDELRGVLGGGVGKTPAHGDFAPWNSGLTTGGKLALWDWEAAHVGAALEDYFHWQFQRLVLMSAGSVEGLVARALNPDAQLLTLCEKLSLQADATPSLLRSYLERSTTELPATTNASRIRAKAIDLLDRAEA